MKSWITASVLLVASCSFARSWTITFDGLSGRYEPKDLFVEVGDTVTWVGDLARDPLVFIEAPKGAKVPKEIKRGKRYSLKITKDGQYYFTSTNPGHIGMGGIISSSYYPSDRPIDFEMMKLPERPKAGEVLHVQLGFETSLIEQVNLCFPDGNCRAITNAVSWKEPDREVQYNLQSCVPGNYMFAIATADTIYRRRLTLY